MSEKDKLKRGLNRNVTSLFLVLRAVLKARKESKSVKKQTWTELEGVSLLSQSNRCPALTLDSACENQFMVTFSKPSLLTTLPNSEAIS